MEIKITLVICAILELLSLSRKPWLLASKCMQHIEFDPERSCLCGRC